MRHIKTELLTSASSHTLAIEERRRAKLRKEDLTDPVVRYHERSKSFQTYILHRAALHIMDDVIVGRTITDAATGPTCFSRHPKDGKQRNQILTLDTHVPLTTDLSIAENAVTALFNAYHDIAKNTLTNQGQLRMVCF